MTQEEKDLLLADLCARLPYGVKISIPDLWTHDRDNEILDEIFKGDDGLYRVNSKGQLIEHIKPYLFPLSSMTEEQIQELESLMEVTTIPKWGEVLSPTPEYYDWLNKNKFDYRGLIPKGLANDATGLNIY